MCRKREKVIRFRSILSSPVLETPGKRERKSCGASIIRRVASEERERVLPAAVYTYGASYLPCRSFLFEKKGLRDHPRRRLTLAHELVPCAVDLELYPPPPLGVVAPAQVGDGLLALLVDVHITGCQKRGKREKMSKLFSGDISKHWLYVNV